jgi:hypothetical protein
MTKAAELAKLGEVMTNSQIGGRRNIAYNGAMQISQRGIQTGQGGAEAMSALDRFKLFGGSTDGRLTSSQDSDSPVGFGNSLKLDCTTADASVAAGEFLLLEQRIEGQDLQQLKYNQSSAETSTISFYVKGNASAQYTFALQYHLSGGTARWFTKGFAVTTDWTRVVITIPGDTQASSGSDYGIADDNATGANLMIWLHGGTNFSSGTHQDTAWADRDYTKLFQDNQTSFFDSTDRTFLITGFQFELGSQATPFEHRSFGEELALCQRYFQDYTENYLQFRGYGYNSTSGNDHPFSFIRTMRAAPTCTEGSDSGDGGSGTTLTSIDLITSSFCSFNIDPTSGNQISYYKFKFTAESEL